MMMTGILVMQNLAMVMEMKLLQQVMAMMKTINISGDILDVGTWKGFSFFTFAKLIKIRNARLLLIGNGTDYNKIKLFTPAEVFKLEGKNSLEIIYITHREQEKKIETAA